MGYDTKYGYISTSKGSIPEDEPVFMIRARDTTSIDVIANYIALCIKAGSPKRHLDLVLNALEEFQKWQNEHRPELKVPASKRHGGMADV